MLTRHTLHPCCNTKSGPRRVTGSGLIPSELQGVDARGSEEQLDSPETLTSRRLHQLLAKKLMSAGKDVVVNVQRANGYKPPMTRVRSMRFNGYVRMHIPHIHGCGLEVRCILRNGCSRLRRDGARIDYASSSAIPEASTLWEERLAGRGDWGCVWLTRT